MSRSFLRPGRRPFPASSAKQCGVALAIVVWFIAAMSLLVAGIVYQAKLETRAAQMHLAQAKVAAAGDGAIQLSLAAITPTAMPPNDRVFRIGDLDVAVNLTPSIGLIDLNRAPAELMVQLFQATGAAPDEAELLADNVIEWRSVSLAGSGHRVDSVESLLQIDGFDRVRIDALREYVASGLSGTGFFRPEHAPAHVRAIVAGQEPGRATANGGGRDGTSRPRRGGRGDANPLRADAYRVDALVEYGGRRWLRRRWVRLGSGAYSDLPWQFTRTEAPRVLRR